MYNMYGIRFDDREFKIGEELPRSNRWEDGSDTGEQLDGTSTLFVSDETNFLDYLDGTLETDDELEKFEWAIKQNYSGKHIYLVAIERKWGYEVGEDDGEMIMNGAEVVRILR